MSGNQHRPPTDEDRKWVIDMAELEEQSGGSPEAAGALATSRARALAKIPGEFKDWIALEDAIRPEVPKKFIAQLKKDIANNNLGGAMTASWRAVQFDLRSKVVALGLHNLEALEGMPALPDADALKAHVTDHDLLSGCLKLNLISKEAYVQLSHCRQLVDGYMESDEFSTEVDRLELLNFIKNAVKYCLAVDRPGAGVDIQEFVTRLESENLTERLSDFEGVLKSQSPQTAGTLIRVLFRRSLETALTAIGEANIVLLFPLAWRYADDASKRAVAEDYVRIRLSGTNDQGTRAWNLLLRAGGAPYLPEAILESYIDEASRALLAAHHGFQNFYNEPEPARRLRELGSKIPMGAREAYVRAIAECYLGNFYGVSIGAQPHLEKMLDGFGSELVAVLVRLLQVDPDIRSTLLGGHPAERLGPLIERVRSRAITTSDREVLDGFLRMDPGQIRDWFNSAR